MYKRWKNFKIIYAALIILSVLLINPVYTQADDTADWIEGQNYCVPMKFYRSSDDSWENPKDVLWGIASNERIQIYDEAVIKKVSQGYEVSLYFHGYHIPDMVQIMDINGAKKAEADNYESVFQVPMGTFNKPDRYKSGTELEKKYASAEADKYYLKDAEITLYNEERDTGKITFKMKDLSEGVYLKSVYTLASRLDISVNTQYISFETGGARQIKQYPQGSYKLGYDWNNYTSVMGISDYSRKYTDRSVNMYNRISLLFDKEVAVKSDKDGKLRAVFHVKNSENIVSIALAGKKKLDFSPENRKREDLEQEFVCSEFTEIWNRDSKSEEIVLDFNDIADARYLRIISKEDYEENKKQSQNDPDNWKAWYAYLKLTPDIKEENDKTLISGDAQLSAKAGALTDNMIFGFEKVEGSVKPRFETEYMVDGVKRFSKGGNSCVTYNCTLTENGAETVPLKEVTLKVKLPDDFDLDTTNAQMIDSKGSFTGDLSRYIDKESRCFIYKISQGRDLNANYSFYDYGKHWTESDMKKLDAGLYKAHVSFAHAHFPTIPSMANQSIASNTAYIEISEENTVKKLKIYYSLEPVYISSLVGYMTGQFYCNGDDQASYTRADILEYYTGNNGSLDFDDWTKKFHFQYLKRVSFPLETPRKNGMYLIRFTVPAMDGKLGDGSGIQVASLRIGDIQKLDDTTINPLKLHDKSVLRALIEKAQRQLKTLEEGSTAYNSLKSALEETEGYYNKADLSEQELIVQRDKLSTALKKSGGQGNLLDDGSYRVPFTVYDEGSENPSLLKSYFKDEAVLKVSGNTMEAVIPINNVQTGAGEDHIIKLKYDSGAALKEAQVINDEQGKISAFKFSRPYTQQRFEIAVFTERQNYEHTLKLAFDFANARKEESSDNDIDKIKLLIAQFKTLNEGDYTKNSFSVMKNAAKEAQNLINQSSQPSSQEISECILKLEKAKRELVYIKELRDRVEEAQKLPKTDALSLALDTAQKVLANDNASKEEVSSAISALDAAIKGGSSDEELNKLREELNEKIKQAGVLSDKKDLYTQESYMVLTQELSKARRIYADSTASAQQLKKQIDSLDEAVSKLMFKSRFELGNKIEELSKYVSSEYTADSWGKFEAALKSAGEIYNDAGKSDDEYKAALASLNTAQAELKKNPDKSAACIQLEQTVESLKKESKDADFYEGTSRKSFEASLEAAYDLLEHAVDYKVSDAQYELQTEALRAEYAALVPVSKAGLKKSLSGISAKDFNIYGEEEFYEMAGTAPLSEEDIPYISIPGMYKLKFSKVDYDAFDIYDLNSPDEQELYTDSEDYRDYTFSDIFTDIFTENGKVLHTASDSNAILTVPDSKNRSGSFGNMPDDFIKNNGIYTDKPKFTDNFGNVFADGVYSVNYNLWQFSKNKASMGDGALVDAFLQRPGKQAKLLIHDAKAYVYVEFQKMEFNTLVGHLLDIKIIDGVKVDEDGVIVEGSYTEIPAEIIEESDETDNFGPPQGRKYPKLVRFDITKYMAAKNQRIPVMVNVPVMGTSAVQPAYIRCYWDTLELVEKEKPDEPDKPDPGKKLDFTHLNKALDDISSINEALYTKKSYAVLEADIAAGEKLKTFTLIEQSDIAGRVKALYASRDALISAKPDKPDKPDKPENPDKPDSPDNSQKTELAALRNKLQLKYMEALDKLRGNYTKESLLALETAMKSALEILNNENATRLQIIRADKNLENALAGLIESQNAGNGKAVNKNALGMLIQTASSMNPNSYTADSWLKVVTALSLARSVYADANAVQSDVDSQTASLRSAIEALVPASNNPDRNKNNPDDKNPDKKSRSDKADGYYRVNVRLWHSNMNKASMGDPALDGSAYVKIDGGDIKMRLVTKKMTTSGITAHLHSFEIYNDGGYESAQMVSSENDRWVFEFTLPNSKSTYYKCKVDPKVDVMGNEPVNARLKVNWSSLKSVSESKWDKLEGKVDDKEDNTKTSGTGSKNTSGTNQMKELSDAATNIKVHGTFASSDTKLEAVKTESEAANNALTGIADKFVLYDIKLRSQSGYVQPAGAVKLSIPIPEGYDKNRLRLYYIGEDGKRETVSGNVNAGFYEAQVTHFSMYALAEVSEGVIAAEKTQIQPGIQDTSVTSKGAQNTSLISSGSGKRKGAAGSGSVSQVSGTGKTAQGNTRTDDEKKQSSNVLANGKKIPYTGDKTPLKALAAGMFIGLFMFIGGFIHKPGQKSVYKPEYTSQHKRENKTGGKAAVLSASDAGRLKIRSVQVLISVRKGGYETYC